MVSPYVLGKTVVMCNDLDTGNTLLIKQYSYRVNPLKLMHMENEIECILKNGIIGPTRK